MQKKIWKKDFSKQANDAVFEKTMENVKKHRDNKLVKTAELPYNKFLGGKSTFIITFILY